MSKKIKLAAVVAAGVVAGGWWAAQPEANLPPTLSIAADAQTATESEAAQIPDMVMGQEDAPVTVVEYASFTCPHCQRFHETVLDQLKTNYIDTGKIKFVYREVYFDKFGLWAAMVARCGGTDKYFGIADIIYDTQQEWLKAENEAGIADNLRKIGLKAGIAPDTLDACLNDNDTARAMVATYQANATKDDISGTPSFIIDGQKYSNMSYEDFAQILDEKLAN